MTATDEELSVVCPTPVVPANVQAERDWRLIKIAGPFSFAAVGVLASLTTPLAQAGISLLAIATYDTDYLLVKNESLERAVEALGAVGHRLIN